MTPSRGGKVKEDVIKPGVHDVCARLYFF